MAPLPGELCQNCLKHIAKKHHPDNQRCTLCLPEDGTLNRCRDCRIARYCSRSCQKQHWKTHKPICRLTVNNAQRAEVAGVSARKDALQAWVYKYYQDLALFGMNALGLQKNRSRTEANVFMVYLDYVEPTSADASRKSKLSHSVRDAVCMPLEKVHQLYASRFAGGSATLERDLAPSPRVLRILVIDDGLPPPFDMFSSPVKLEENLRAIPYFPSWLAEFKRRVNV